MRRFFVIAATAALLAMPIATPAFATYGDKSAHENDNARGGSQSNSKNQNNNNNNNRSFKSCSGNCYGSTGNSNHGGRSSGCASCADPAGRPGTLGGGE